MISFELVGKKSGWFQVCGSKSARFQVGGSIWTQPKVSIVLYPNPDFLSDQFLTPLVKTAAKLVLWKQSKKTTFLFTCQKATSKPKVFIEAKCTFEHKAF